MKKIDGNTIQEEIASSLVEAISVLKQGSPKLALFALDANEETKRYVQKKKDFGTSVGCKITTFLNEGDWSTEDIIKEIQVIQNTHDAVVVQLPLPPHVDTRAVLESIDPAKDIDALSSRSLFVSPVALAIQKMLEKVSVWKTLQDKKVVLVGAGETVGKPVAKFLQSSDIHDLIILTKDSADSESQKAFASADVVISGAGVPGLVTSGMIKPGVVLIDAGFSFKDGKVSGDIDSSCFEKASYYSTVPGGVGPVAIACLFENLVHAKNNSI